MTMLYLLIPLGLVLLGVALWAFFWAVAKKQFDSLERHAFMALEEKQPESAEDTPLK